jgi:hypothetical protein
MFDRLILTEELLDSRGALVAARGTVLSAQSIAEVARRTPPPARHVLADTALAAEVAAPLSEPAYRHLFAGEGVRDAIRSALLGVRLPDPLLQELLAVRRETPLLHVHAFATAAVAVRILLSVVGAARTLPELAAAALLHDLGMRHLPARLLEHDGELAQGDAALIAAHPLVGAYHVASMLGNHPAVDAARCHHWRCGQGYPTLQAPPSRSVEVISVASTFAALTQPRPFRASVYDARGASDVLAAEAVDGHADANTVKLLVHALRGGRGDPRSIRFGRPREGHGPDVHRYVHVAAPARSPV